MLLQKATSKRSPPPVVNSGLPLSLKSLSSGSAARDCTVAQSLMRLLAHRSACSDEKGAPAWAKTQVLASAQTPNCGLPARQQSQNWYAREPACLWWKAKSSRVSDWSWGSALSAMAGCQGGKPHPTLKCCCLSGPEPYSRMQPAVLKGSAQPRISVSFKTASALPSLQRRWCRLVAPADAANMAAPHLPSVHRCHCRIRTAPWALGCSCSVLSPAIASASIKAAVLPYSRPGHRKCDLHASNTY